MRTAVSTSSTSLTNQSPTIRQMEHQREGISMTIVRLNVHLSVYTVTLLITRFGISPTCSCSTLRGDKCGGSIREVKAGSLTKYQCALLVARALCNTIPKGNIVVRHHKGNGHLKFFLVLDSQHQLVCLVVDVRLLDGAHIVMLLYGLSLVTYYLQTVYQVANTSVKPQVRFCNHLFAVQRYLIGSLATLIAHHDFQISTR